MSNSESISSYTQRETRAGRAGPDTSPGARGTRRGEGDGGPGVQKIDGIAPNGLLTNRLLKSLPGADFARLLPHLEPVAFPAGECAYNLDQKIRFGYFPETVVISHLHVLADGGMTEAAMIGREGMVGLSAVFGSHPPPYWTQVTVAGIALRISSDILREEFSRGGALQKSLLVYTSARIAQLSQRAVCNGRHKVLGRLCSWLLMVHDRAGEGQLLLTHEQIASHLGVRRAGITAAAISLRERGIISHVRGQINILNRPALEMSACECYRPPT